MIKKYNKISLILGVPGLLLQFGSVFFYLHAAENANQTVMNLAIAVRWLGTIMFLMGLGYYAKAKGRSPAWCLLAFFSCVGLLILACLKDLSEEDLGGPKAPVH